MKHDPPAVPLARGARHGDVNRPRFSVRAGLQSPARTAVDAPQFGRAGLAEDGAFPASEDSRHPKTVITQSVMADGINTAMNAVQAGGFETAVDPGEGKSGRSQLIGRDDAVLACRKTSNEGVGPRFVAFLPHVRKKGDKDADLAPSSPGIHDSAPL